MWFTTQIFKFSKIKQVSQCGYQFVTLACMQHLTKHSPAYLAAVK